MAPVTQIKQVVTGLGLSHLDKISGAPRVSQGARVNPCVENTVLIELSSLNRSQKP